MVRRINIIKLACIILLLICCEKPSESYECKECTYIEDDKEYTVFVCGEELQKYENDGLKCVKISCKDNRIKQ